MGQQLNGDTLDAMMDIFGANQEEEVDDDDDDDDS